MKMEQRVPKYPHIKFRRRGIAQKKEYSNPQLFKYNLSDDMWNPVFGKLIHEVPLEIKHLKY